MTRIIIQRGPEGSNHWLRFVVLFCFIYFYVRFVGSGFAFWQEDWPQYRQGDLGSEFWINLIQVASAIVMYLCGRSLWTITTSTG